MAGQILIEITIASGDVLRGATAPMVQSRTGGDVEFYDFDVLSISRITQTIGNLEFPQISPERAQIYLHSRGLEDVDLAKRPIKVFYQEDGTDEADAVKIFEGYTRFPGGIERSEDTITLDVESLFFKDDRIIELKTYSPDAGDDAGKKIPGYWGHFLDAPMKTYQASNHSFIVSSFPLVHSDGCPVVVRKNGTVLPDTDYDVDYIEGVIIFLSNPGAGTFTMDGCGVARTHINILKSILTENLGEPESAIGDSFDGLPEVDISYSIDRDTHALKIIEKILYETLIEMSYRDGEIFLHSRFDLNVEEIPEAYLLTRSGRLSRATEENSGRLYANRVLRKGSTDFFEDMAEIERVGKIEKELDLELFSQNETFLNSRLLAYSQMFASKDSAMATMEFDRRAIDLFPGEAIKIADKNYYILEKTLRFGDAPTVSLYMWQRPEKALAPKITGITRLNGNVDVRIDWDIAAQASAAALPWQLEIRGINRTTGEDRDFLYYTGDRDERSIVWKEEDMRSVFTFAARIVRAGYASEWGYFASYGMPSMNLTGGPNRFDASWTVAGNSAAKARWSLEGMKYRVYYRRSFESDEQAKFQDFTSDADTNAWSVRVSDIAAGNYVVWYDRIWNNSNSNFVSGKDTVTVNSSTLARPTASLRQESQNLIFSWDPVPAATTYLARVRPPGVGSWSNITERESPIVVKDDIEPSDNGGVYRAQVRAEAHGYTNSAWGSAEYTLTRPVPPRMGSFSVRTRRSGETVDTNNQRFNNYVEQLPNENHFTGVLISRTHANYDAQNTWNLRVDFPSTAPGGATHYVIEAGVGADDETKLFHAETQTRWARYVMIKFEIPITKTYYWLSFVRSGDVARLGSNYLLLSGYSRTRKLKIRIYAKNAYGDGESETFEQVFRYIDIL